MSQENSTDSTSVEKSIEVKKEKKNKKELSFMGKAMLWSFIPGAGQVYVSKFSNRPKWIGRNPWVWKIPIIYGALGASAYFIYTNQQQHQLYRSTYNERTKDGGNSDLPHINEGSQTLNLDGSALIELQSQYQNWRDLSIFIFVGVYLLNIVDAGVQAHFCKFDVSPNLSLSVEPAMPSINSFGAGLKLNFK